MVDNNKLLTPQKEKLGTCEPDNCILSTSGQVILLTDVKGSIMSGYELILESNLYDYPYQSSQLHIGFYVKSKSHVTCNSISKKCICFPLAKGTFVVIPYATQTSFYS
jgi:hypothetical protein